MAILSGLLFILLLIAIASIPSLLLWWLAWKYLPTAYTLPPLRMTGLCMLLVFLTGGILNLELKNGAITFADMMLELTLLWTLVLLPAVFLIKYFRANQAVLEEKK